MKSVNDIHRTLMSMNKKFKPIKYCKNKINLYPLHQPQPLNKVNYDLIQVISLISKILQSRWPY